MLGAFGAHGLANVEGITSRLLETWDTAVLYHLIHGVAMLVVAVLALIREEMKWLSFIFLAFAVGIALFSGSLYALVLGAPAWFGPITPLGGSCLILGWVMLAVSSISTKSG